MGMLVLAVLSLTAMSCKDANKEHDNADGHHNEATEQNDMMKNESMNTAKSMNKMGQDDHAEAVLTDYFILKDALAADDKAKASEAGKKLVSTLGDFDYSTYSKEEQTDLEDIIADATEHAEHISTSEMGHQREHFKMLSKDVMDMVAITGSKRKMYEQFCPMYDNGSAWLSMSSEISNPYYGSKMLKCGRVEREIN